ncbi:MAG: type I methionyl aminopeptidase [Flavitalea sp.]
MIHYKTNAEIELMRESALLVGKAIAEAVKILKPGVTTARLDAVVDMFIHDNGGTPSFKGYHGFPFASCMSVNDAVVHGFPNNKELMEGDIVSMDVGVFKNGFHGDSAYTVAIVGASEDALLLMKVTRISLGKGVEKAVAGNRTGDIAFAVQDYCEKEYKYGVVRELVCHGLGRKLHEDPQVPNFGKRGSGTKLQEGVVIAIEPMVNMGVKEVWYDKDGWTVRTKDGKIAAHYEHNVCVKKGGPDQLSSFDDIEKAERSNDYLISNYY